MTEGIDDLALVEEFVVVTKISDELLELGQRCFIVCIVEDFEPDEVDGIFDHIEFWRIGREMVKSGLDGQVCGFLAKKVLHFFLVGGVPIEEQVDSLKAFSLKMGGQIGQIIGHMLRFCRWVGLKKAICREQLDG